MDNEKEDDTPIICTSDTEEECGESIPHSTPSINPVDFVTTPEGYELSELDEGYGKDPDEEGDSYFPPVELLLSQVTNAPEKTIHVPDLKVGDDGLANIAQESKQKYTFLAYDGATASFPEEPKLTKKRKRTTSNNDDDVLGKPKTRMFRQICRREEKLHKLVRATSSPTWDPESDFADDEVDRASEVEEIPATLDTDGVAFMILGQHQKIWDKEAAQAREEHWAQPNTDDKKPMDEARPAPGEE